MHRYIFEEDDLFINRLKTYPEYNVFIYQGIPYTNSFKPLSGSLHNRGGLTVFDINSNRTTTLIKPHVTASLRKDVLRFITQLCQRYPAQRVGFFNASIIIR